MTQSGRNLHDALGLYLHWPYCARICPYCDFNVYRPKGEEDALLAAMLVDMTRWRELTDARPLASLHFGGGTPSLMSETQLARLIEHAGALWGFEAGAEIGLEANPNDMDGFAGMAAAGINRLSLGVQSLSDEALDMLGRDHDANEARRAIESGQGLFDRLSVDMIYARAGQSADEWRTELQTILDSGVAHVSPYQLTIESGTAFGKRRERGERLTSEAELGADLYALTEEVCTAAGLGLYEISNFARSLEDQSRHNRLYWDGGDWIGIGPGAHGRLGRHGSGGRRAIAPERRPSDYIRVMDSDGWWPEDETLSATDEAAERILMGLRLVDGLDRSALRLATGRDINADQADEYAAQGLVELDGDIICLTAQGRIFADRISNELVPDD